MGLKKIYACKTETTVKSSRTFRPSESQWTLFCDVFDLCVKYVPFENFLGGNLFVVVQLNMSRIIQLTLTSPVVGFLKSWLRLFGSYRNILTLLWTCWGKGNAVISRGQCCATDAQMEESREWWREKCASFCIVSHCDHSIWTPCLHGEPVVSSHMCNIIRPTDGLGRKGQALFVSVQPLIL